MFLALLLLVVMGCGKMEKKAENSMLYGTWKLVKVKYSDGRVREIDTFVKKCSSCYIVTFKKDNTFNGVTCANYIEGKYSTNIALNEVKVESLGITKIHEPFCPNEPFVFEGKYTNKRDTLLFVNDTITTYYKKIKAL